MRELPIIFNGDMVRAILDGRKSMTRRLVKPQPTYPDAFQGLRREMDGATAKFWRHGAKEADLEWTCPYAPGDHLYVRETWRPKGDAPLSQCIDWRDISFAASEDEAGLAIFRWRPSIHMPKWAARLWLEVTDVRAERLQEITEEDACAEGVEWDSWEEPLGEGYIWESNPWVWAISFRRIEQAEGGR